MDGINSAALLRRLVDEHIERCLTQPDKTDAELLVGLLKRAGFAEELERVLAAAIRTKALESPRDVAGLHAFDQVRVGEISGKPARGAHLAVERGVVTGRTESDD